jgi:hypothetical protein
MNGDSLPPRKSVIVVFLVFGTVLTIARSGHGEMARDISYSCRLNGGAGYTLGSQDAVHGDVSLIFGFPFSSEEFYLVPEIGVGTIGSLGASEAESFGTAEGLAGLRIAWREIAMIGVGAHVTFGGLFEEPDQGETTALTFGVRASFEVSIRGYLGLEAVYHWWTDFDGLNSHSIGGVLFVDILLILYDAWVF